MYTKLNPFQQIIEAFRGITDTTIYYKLRKQSTFSKILYAVIFFTILNLALESLAAFRITSNKEINHFLNELPEFSYIDGRFTFENRLERQNKNIYGVLDTEQLKWDINQITLVQDSKGNIETNSYRVGDASDINTYIQKGLEDDSITELFLISRTNLVHFYLDSFTYEDISISDLANRLHITAFSKQQVLSDYKGFVWKFCLLAGLIMIPFSVIGIFLGTLIFALFGLIINALTRAHESFSTVYWLSFYIYTMICGFSLLDYICNPFSKIYNLVIVLVSFAQLIAIFVLLTFTLLKGEKHIVKSVVVNDLNDDLDSFMQNYPESRAAVSYSSSLSSAYEKVRESEDSGDNDSPVKKRSSGLSLKLAEPEQSYDLDD